MVAGWVARRKQGLLDLWLRTAQTRWASEPAGRKDAEQYAASIRGEGEIDKPHAGLPHEAAR